jgi:hypothetical protein
LFFFYGKNIGKTYLISAGIFPGSFLKNLGNFLKYQEISREKYEKAADIWRKNCRNCFLGQDSSIGYSRTIASSHNKTCFDLPKKVSRIGIFLSSA